jgi:hypothetical protein
MASSTNPMNPFIGIIISQKLSKANPRHVEGTNIMLTAIRGSRLSGHLTGAIPVPAIQVVTTVDMARTQKSLIPHIMTCLPQTSRFCDSFYHPYHRRS